MKKPLLVGITVVLTSAIGLMFMYQVTQHPKHAGGDHSLPAGGSGGQGQAVVPEQQRRSVDAPSEDPARSVAFVTVGSGQDMDALRIFVASVHHWHPGSPILIYVSAMNKAQLQEARNWEHTEVVLMQHILRDPAMKEEDFVALAVHDAAELHGAAVYIPKSLYAKKPLNAALATLHEQGYVVGGCDAQDASAHKDLCTGVSHVIGFVHNSTATKLALDTACKCTIDNTCRGTVFAELVHNVPSVQRLPALVTMLRIADLANKEDPAHELVSHLRERDPFVHHARATGDDSDAASGDSPGTKHEHAKPTHSGKTHVCMLVPSTTKGKHGEQLEHNPSELPFFQLFLRSLVNTVRGDADTGKYAFSVYLGIDVGDPIYDNHQHFDRVQAMFNEMTGDLHMHLRVKKFGSEFRGKPAWFWNGLFEEAYTTDNCDYFYQINDDVESLTPGWMSRFIDKLRTNPRRADLGMAGPGDVGNQKTMTQSFCHRTHFDIFGTYYPRSLQNWFSDDWATHIYDPVQSTFWMKDIQIRNHNPKGTRYTECNTCEALYLQELSHGRDVLNKWLQAHP